MKRIFSGIRVLEFTTAIAGPVAAALLADQSAEVIKIEKRGSGDEMRLADPFVDGESLTFMWANRGKKCMVLPLDTPDGLRLAKELIKTADVILENFRPGVMKKYGLDYEGAAALKPDIVYCSVSAFGQTGPYRKEAGYDYIAQAMSGIMDMTGDPDRPPAVIGTLLGDYTAACNAFGAIAAALYHRERTGEGNYIDLSLVEALTCINHNIEPCGAGAERSRCGHHASGAAPFGLYNGNNGEGLMICAHTPKHFRLLCLTMGRPDLLEDPRMATRKSRFENLPMLVEAVESYLKTFPSVDEPMRLLREAGVPVTKAITTPQVLTDPHFNERGIITDIPVTSTVHSIKSFKGRGIYMKFSNTPGEIGTPPALGEHNSDILRELGLNEEEIQTLNSQWLEDPS